MRSQRENAMAQIASDLGEVNGRSPFTNIIRKVARDLPTASQINVTPYAFISDEGEDEERVSSIQQRFYLLHLGIGLVVEPRSDVAASTQLNSILADVKYAMTAGDYYRHKNTVLRSLYRGCRPLAIEGAPLVGTMAIFDFHYDDLWNQP